MEWNGWMGGSLQFDAVDVEGFELVQVFFYDGYVYADADVADFLACGGRMGRVGWREMGALHGDEVGCLGGVSSGGSVTIFDNRERFIWRFGRFVDGGEGGTYCLGFRSRGGVRVLGFGFGGACALCRARGSVVGIGGLTLALLFGIMGGVAGDFFGIQDRDGARGGGCVAGAVGVFEICGCGRCHHWRLGFFVFDLGVFGRGIVGLIGLVRPGFEGSNLSVFKSSFC